MEYKIVESGSRKALENYVNGLLKEGWKLQGGCAGYIRGNDSNTAVMNIGFVQAMIKE